MTTDDLTGRLAPRRSVFMTAIAASLVVLSACVPTPPPKLPEAPQVPQQQKMAWILQLEDQRLLRFELPAPPPPPPPVKGKKPAPVVVPPPPSSLPDLSVLVRDGDARVRRRAALAIGRVKAKAGVPLLVSALPDTDPDVRAMAAFALGLIGDGSAEAALAPFLTDASPLVRGRAAEALGLIGAKGAAPAIGQMVAEYATSAPVAAMQPDDEAESAAAGGRGLQAGVVCAGAAQGVRPARRGGRSRGGQPVTAWWPVAYALQRVEDPRAAPALLQLLGSNGRYTRAFAARGLGTLKDPSAVKPLLALLDPAAKAGLELTVAAVRALAQLGATEAAAALARLAGYADGPSEHPARSCRGTRHAAGRRRVAVGAGFVDRRVAGHARGRVAGCRGDRSGELHRRAGGHGTRSPLARSRGIGRDARHVPRGPGHRSCAAMLQDEDKRVIPAVLSSLARLKATDLRAVLLEQRLDDPDFVVRATAARELGTLKPEGGAEALRQAYKTALPDSPYTARTAALDALAAYGAAESASTLVQALEDKDWAVRVRADELLAKLEPTSAAARTIAPVPGQPIAPYDDPMLIGPTTSPHVFIETSYGTIEFELAVLDAPQTSRSFIELVRKGFFNGLEVHRVVANFVVQYGDPRGDGEGGPGYTIRDELSQRPYLRGTVGMALEWRDTGGSQFFITLSPQPHLDARYTVFGHVVNGMDVVDRIKPGDVIQRIRVWDGSGWVESR